MASWRTLRPAGNYFLGCDAMAADDGTDVQDYARKKRWVVVALFIYAFVFGVVSCLAGDEDRGINFILGLPFVVLLVSWCIYDAAERGDRISRLMLIGLIFLGLPALFIYLFGTRGLRGFRAIFVAVLVVLGVVATSFATASLTIFVGESIGVFRHA